MLSRLFGSESSLPGLKAGLDRSTQSVREIAHRVANASSGLGGDFVSALEDASGAVGESGVDLEQEMVALADEQLRFETATRLMEKVYQQIRTSVREG